MKYLSFIRGPESFRDVQPPAALMEAIGTLVARARKAGTLIDTGGLESSKTGFRIRQSRGKLAVTDGPFTETKEVIAGWAMIEVKSHEEAVRFSTEFMELHRVHWPEFECECEVRPMFDPGV